MASVLNLDCEALRARFRPADVRVLFVGESPPKSGTFFYAANSELYRATRDAFSAALPDSNSVGFLEYFAASGCYLEDLCHDPVNHLTSHDDGSWRKRLEFRRKGEANLAQTITSLKPNVIVVLLKGIAGNVARAASFAGCSNVEQHVLTYPSRWHRHRIMYRTELANLLQNLLQRGVLDSLHSEGERKSSSACNSER